MNTLVHQLVERQARRTPDAAAVLCGGERITYAELDRRAERLARALRRHGVGPEVAVGLHLSRSTGLAVAVLAVLKAGGVCVPLDPAYPPERLAFVLDDIAARVVLTERRAAPRLPDHSATVLCPDDGAEGTEAPDDRPPPGPLPALHPRNLAWVAYTSGSTGRPKGVGLAHGPLANLATGIGQRLGLGPGDRVLQFASIGFSVAAEEILSAWATGACLVIDPDDSLTDAAGLLSVVEKQAVTVMQLTPAYWYEWLRELDRDPDGTPRPPASLRLLVVGSEQVAADRVADWLPTGVRLVQEYGATEGTVSQLLYEPRGSAAEMRGRPRVPIGTPLPGVRVHLLDASLRPVPDGEPGELYIAGDAVARGYPGRPGLTAERFVADPYADRPGGRMYRTGDLARRLPDGNLEFLGRTDHQITMRGIRIEPGEVESAIGRYPGVAQSAVLARRTAAGADQLCACVVWQGERDDAGLRDHLRATLAPALVPSRFIPVPDLPLNPNGKVDRRALRTLPLDPAPDPAAPAMGPAAPETAPRSPLQAALAGVWALALGVPRVGIDDDFFALGGDSLTATRLASQLREALSVDIRQRMLFEAPTVRALAELLSARRGPEGTGTPAVAAAAPSAAAPTAASAAVFDPSATAGEPERAPLSPSQRRMWLLHKMAPAGAAYNDPVALRLRGPLDPDPLRHALRQTVRRHAALRTTIGSEDGHPVQLIAPPAAATWPLTLLDLTGRPDAELRARADRLAATPFDLRSGPLCRAALLRAGADDHVLLLVFHHIVVDGWSMDVLFRDLAAFYRQARTGAPAQLPPLPVSYAAYATHRGEQGAGPADDRQLAYWKTKLRDAPQVTRLPPDADGSRSGGIRRPFLIRAEAAARLRELAAAEQATPFMVMLAGFKALVHRANGTRDVVVGSLLAGRDRPETADLIGLFTNTVALRTRLPGGVTFRRLVGRVRQTVHEAVAHQDVPFERVVAELRPPRDRRRNPVFQLMFSYGSTTVRRPEFPGLTVTPLQIDTGAAKFDATVMLEESECGGYSGMFEYDLALYSESAARRFTKDFQEILERAAEFPDDPL